MLCGSSNIALPPNLPLKGWLPESYQSEWGSFHFLLSEENFPLKPKITVTVADSVDFIQVAMFEVHFPNS